MKTYKTYMVEGWIHPKHGGSDRFFMHTITASSVRDAKAKTRNWLSKRSAITTDFGVGVIN